uniref:uncharacterized protein LOC125405082 n=1 Tax=Myodes glareolus TaxID=447135 RepID=UPI002021D1D8|nr:uncharacterized protein LOC125405082 [Myodes glareolus]
MPRREPESHGGSLQARQDLKSRKAGTSVAGRGRESSEQASMATTPLERQMGGGRQLRERLSVQEARFFNSKARAPQEGGTPYDCTRSTNDSARQDSEAQVHCGGDRGPAQPPSNPGIGPAQPNQASAPNTVRAVGPGAPRTDARVRPISGRRASGCPRFPERSGPALRRRAGRRRRAASRRGPDPLPRARPPPSAAPPRPPCSLRASPRADTETETGIPSKSCTRHYPLLAAAPPHIQTPAKWRGGKGGGHSACASEAETRGGARDALGPPRLEGPIVTQLWPAVTSQDTVSFDAGCWFGFLSSDQGVFYKWLIVAFNCWMDCARSRQRRERPSILRQAEKPNDSIHLSANFKMHFLLYSMGRSSLLYLDSEGHGYICLCLQRTSLLLALSHI